MNTIILIIVLLVKNLFMLIILLCQKKFESSHNARKFKLGDRVKSIKYKNIFSNGYTKKKGQKKYL